MTATTTKVMLELKAGVESAITRLREVTVRRGTETILVQNEADENDSGWSEEEWDARKPASRATLIDSADFHRLFYVIGQVATLRELILDYYANPIPVKALAHLFSGRSSESNRLEALMLRHVNLVGDESNFRAFSASISSLWSLEKVCITSCKSDTAGTSEALVHALTSLSAVKEMTLEEMVISSQSLAAICRLPTLSTLKLRHIPASNQHMSLMAHAISTSQSLRSLQIRYALDQDAALSFFRILEEYSSLEAIDIDVDCWDGCGIPLAKALTTNTNLSNVEINVFGKGQDSHLDANASALAEALSENATLKRLCLTFHNRFQQDNTHPYIRRIANAFVGPVERIIPKNTALGELLVGLVHQRISWGAHTCFYLTVNKAGRQQFLEANGASRKEWIDTFIRHRDDLNVLYYFLSMNPSLMDIPLSLSPPPSTSTNTSKSTLTGIITTEKSVSDALVRESTYKRFKWDRSSRQTTG